MRYRFADYELDTADAFLYHVGRPIELQHRVFAVLRYLIEHQGRVVSKDELATQVWQSAIDNTTIESCIKKARRAIGDSGRGQRVIATRIGFGYIFVAPVVALTTPCMPPPPSGERMGTVCPEEPGALPPPVSGPTLGHAGESPSAYTSGGLPRSQAQGRTHTALPLIGRRQELACCAHSLAEARQGTPGVVLIEGDAGIGKTRLLTEVSALAVQQGFQVYAGRCYEDLALPYLPFVSAVLADIAQAPTTQYPTLRTERAIIRRFLGYAEVAVSAAQGALLFPVDEDKLRLFLAITQVIMYLARQHPVLLVLDDLHWADGPTLDLLSHLVYSVADTTAAHTPVPLCMLVTFRPVSATERLGRLVARFQQETICQTLPLPGLEEPESATLLQALAITRPTHQLVALVQAATQGNPLFIQEVVRQLRHQGALREQHNRTAAAVSLADVRLPAQIRSALAVRVQALGPACQHMLTLAACLGESASFQMLKAVSGMDDLPLLDLLEEGVRQGILESAGQGFQFAHPLLRHVVYSALSPIRRQHMHHQIATVLERLSAGQREVSALEMAHHWIEAGALAERDTVLAATRQAGDQALRMFAWQEAAHYYEAALAVAGEMLPLPERAALHYRAGLAYYRDQDVGPCLAHYDHAIAAYRLTEDVHGLAAVLMDKTEMQYTLASLPFGVQADLQPLEEVLEVLGEDAPGLRGRMYTVMSQAHRFGQQEARAQALAQQALALGQALADDELCALAGFALGLAYLPSLQIHQALESWRNALAAAQRINNLPLQGWPLARLPLGLMLLGRLAEAEAQALEAYTFTRTLRDWGTGVSVALSHLASASVARGDFAATERYTEEAMQAMSRSGYPWGGFRALMALACAHTLRGAWDLAEAALHTLAEPGRVFQEPGAVLRIFVTIFRHLVQAYAGTREDTLPFQIADVMAQLGTDSYALAPLCALVALADILALPSLATQPWHVLSRLADQGVRFSSGWVYLLPRVLGVAATLHQQWDAAETYFQTAVEVATGSHAWPELALTYLDHARMLARRGAPGDQQRARALRICAEPLVDKLGMQLWYRCIPRRTDTR